MCKNKETEMTTYLITHEDRTERKITVPSDWKVTFGPAARGVHKYSGPSGGAIKIPLALRFYESENKQRAIFTDVLSFRDMSIRTEVKQVKVQEKQGYMECDGQRKATTFTAKSEEWVDPDELGKVPALPMSENMVADFDVEFKAEKEINNTTKKKRRL